jgi:heparinase II/III-like protein
MTAPMEKLRRLRYMGWDEWRVRTRQEVAKRWDFVVSQIGIRFPEDGGYVPRSHASGRFFFGRDEVPPILDCLRQRLPEVVEEIVERAEKICQHRFDLLGYEDVDYGAEIDWHLDAVHGKRAPRRPWFRVRYLDFDQVGDSKVTWELNRHQHLVTLAKAYRFTGEARYAREVFRQWYDWQDQNPYGIGINWASSLEVAFRSLSWLWVWYLLNGSSTVPQRFSFDLRRALMLNGRHIEQFLSTYFSPNTHLLGEGAGLFFIGTLCSGSTLAQRWQKLGWQIVLREAERQVRPDGMHFEQSTYYHTYALDFLLHSRILADLNGVPVPTMLDRTMEKMLDVLCTLGRAGSVPQFGDDDGGRVFDPRRNRAGDLLDPLATGAVLFDRGDFKSVAGSIREETVWLLGPAGARWFEGRSLQQLTAASFSFEHSGIYVMSSENPLLRQLVINAGPHGAGRSGHRHADALSVQLAVNGQPLLIDPGTFAYVDSDAERNRFRETACHNTAQVDDLSQAEPSGPFGWEALPNAGVDRWVTGKTFDLFVGSHRGYCRLRQPVQHRRYVFHSKPNFWLIRDVLEGEGVHQLEVSWHFAPGSLSPIPGGTMFVSGEHAALAVLIASSQDCSWEVTQGWYSPIYGRKEPSPILRVSSRAELPVEFAALLIPIAKADAAPGLFQLFESRHKGVPVRAYRYAAADVANYMVFANEAGTWQVGPWVSDARFLFCSTRGEESVQQLAIHDGSYVELSGRQVFKSEVPLILGEWRPDEPKHPARVGLESSVHAENVPLLV